MPPSVKIRFLLATALAFAFSVQAQTPRQSPQHAQVTYADGKLFVWASNSSLNQILRDICMETGMEMTGGVTDERVYGRYGPAAPAKILSELLEGTGSNMLLVHATAATPAELILTARQGTATPPAAQASSDEESPRPQYPMAAPEEDAAPAAAEPAPRSPNAVKTPQQIYEQLERMRQQQQQRQANPQ